MLLTGLISIDWFLGKQYFTGSSGFWLGYAICILGLTILTPIMMLSLAFQQISKRRIRWTLLIPILDFVVIYLNGIIWGHMLY